MHATELASTKPTEQNRNSDVDNDMALYYMVDTVVMRCLRDANGQLLQQCYVDAAKYIAHNHMTAQRTRKPSCR